MLWIQYLFAISLIALTKNNQLQKWPNQRIKLILIFSGQTQQRKEKTDLNIHMDWLDFVGWLSGFFFCMCKNTHSSNHRASNKNIDKRKRIRNTFKRTRKFKHYTANLDSDENTNSRTKNAYIDVHARILPIVFAYVSRCACICEWVAQKRSIAISLGNKVIAYYD